MCNAYRWAGVVISSYFHGEHLRLMITNFVWPDLDDLDTNKMCFHQDGVTCFIAYATVGILYKRFEGMVVSCGVTTNWPPESCVRLFLMGIS